jgi:hypothetical protein
MERETMPDVYYCCHGCGSIHEVEAIRRNLHVAGRPVADAWPPQHRPLGWLERRRAATLLVRGLWGGRRGRAVRSWMRARMPVAAAPHRSFPGGGKGRAPVPRPAGPVPPGCRAHDQQPLSQLPASAPSASRMNHADAPHRVDQSARHNV